MITAKLITDAYVFLRTNNHSIPDEVLDFIKGVSLAALQSQNSIKLPVSGWQEFLEQQPPEGQLIVMNFDDVRFCTCHYKPERLNDFRPFRKMKFVILPACH